MAHSSISDEGLGSGFFWRAPADAAEHSGVTSVSDEAMVEKLGSDSVCKILCESIVLYTIS